MKTSLRQVFLSAQLGALVAIAPLPSAAADQSTFLDQLENGAAKTFDLAILRPLGGLRLVVGMAAMVPMTIINTIALPFQPDSGAYRETAELFIVEPANYVFRRPLGEDLAGS